MSSKAQQYPAAQVSFLPWVLVCTHTLTPHTPDPTCPNFTFIRIQVGTTELLHSAFSCIIYVNSFLRGKKKRRKEKIFNMLFKLINIMNQRQFGKSVLWLQAHCGSAHLVKLSLAEASFYLEESGTGSPSITGTAHPSPAPERFTLFTHSLTSCHPSPSTFLFLILDAFPKLQLHNPFTCCDHQTKTRKRLELKFPAG